MLTISLGATKLNEGAAGTKPLGSYAPRAFSSATASTIRQSSCEGLAIVVRVIRKQPPSATSVALSAIYAYQVHNMQLGQHVHSGAIT